MPLLTVAPVLAGLALGYLLGGRPAGLRAIRFRALWLVWLAAGVQFTQYALDAGGALLALTFALVLCWVGINLPLWPGAIRIAAATIVLGAALNGLAIAANGRMPYAPAAAAAAGLSPGTETPKNEPAGAGTRLAVLGDTIPIRAPRAVISPGDLLIGAGTCALITLAMRTRRR